MHHNSQHFETCLKVSRVLVWLFSDTAFVSGLDNLCFLTWDKTKIYYLRQRKHCSASQMISKLKTGVTDYRNMTSVNASVWVTGRDQFLCLKLMSCSGKNITKLIISSQLHGFSLQQKMPTISHVSCNLRYCMLQAFSLLTLAVALNQWTHDNSLTYSIIEKILLVFQNIFSRKLRLQWNKNCHGLIIPFLSQ